MKRSIIFGIASIFASGIFAQTAQFSELRGNNMDITWEGVARLSPGNTKGAYLLNAADERIEMYYLEDDYYSKANLRITDNNKLLLNITNNYPELPGGSYRLFIPDGYVKFDGGPAVNEAIEGYEFFYDAPWREGDVEMAGPTDEGLLNLTWIKASEVEYNTDYKGDGFGTTGVVIYNPSGSQVAVPYPSNISFSGNVMTINLEGLQLEEGECQLVIPEDCLYVTVNGVKDLTNGVILRFNFEGIESPEDPGDDNPDEPDEPGEPGEPGEDDGIEEILDTDGTFIIYNLNGIRLMETEQASAISNLPKGVYIINGKKIVK